jgi:hypothetical protein
VIASPARWVGELFSHHRMSELGGGRAVQLKKMESR